MATRGIARLIVTACAATACSALVSLDDLRGPETDASADASDANLLESGDAPSDAVILDAPSNTITFVQSTADYYSSAGLAFATPITTGDAVILIVSNSKPGSVTVSDAKSNAYVSVIGAYSASDGGTLQVFVAFGVQGGFTTLLVSAPDSGPGYTYYAAEYNGIKKLDGFAEGSTQSTGTDALTSSSVPTTAAPELLFAYAEGLGNVKIGSGFTARSLFDGNALEERIVNTSGNYQATATLLGGTGDIVLVCFH